MTKRNVIALILAVFIGSSIVFSSGISYKAEAAGSSVVSTEAKYESKIKDILKKRNEGIGANQSISVVQEFKVNSSFTLLLVTVIRSQNPFKNEQYLMDVTGAGKVLYKESAGKYLDCITDQTFITANSSVLFYEYSSSTNAVKIFKVTAKKAIEQYQYNELYSMEYVPQLLIDKSGNYIFYTDGFSNGAEGGPGQAMIAQLDTKAKVFKTKYKLNSNNYVLDKSKNLWVLDCTTKDKTNIVFTISTVVNGKKTVKYTVNYKNQDQDVPIAWVNVRLKVVSDKEVYIEYPGSQKWTKVSK